MALPVLILATAMSLVALSPAAYAAVGGVERLIALEVGACADDGCASMPDRGAPGPTAKPVDPPGKPVDPPGKPVDPVDPPVKPVDPPVPPSNPPGPSPPPPPSDVPTAPPAGSPPLGADGTLALLRDVWDATDSAPRLAMGEADDAFEADGMGSAGLSSGFLQPILPPSVGDALVAPLLLAEALLAAFVSSSPVLILPAMLVLAGLSSRRARARLLELLGGE